MKILMKSYCPVKLKPHLLREKPNPDEECGCVLENSLLWQTGKESCKASQGFQCNLSFHIAVVSAPSFTLISGTHKSRDNFSKLL